MKCEPVSYHANPGGSLPKRFQAEVTPKAYAAAAPRCCKCCNNSSSGRRGMFSGWASMFCI